MDDIEIVETMGVNLAADTRPEQAVAQSKKRACQQAGLPERQVAAHPTFGRMAFADLQQTAQAADPGAIGHQRKVQADVVGEIPVAVPESDEAAVITAALVLGFEQREGPGNVLGGDVENFHFRNRNLRR